MSEGRLLVFGAAPAGVPGLLRHVKRCLNAAPIFRAGAGMGARDKFTLQNTSVSKSTRLIFTDSAECGSSHSCHEELQWGGRQTGGSRVWGDGQCLIMGTGFLIGATKHPGIR